MRKLVAAVVLATAIANPALAQSYDPSVGSGNLHNSPSPGEVNPRWTRPSDAYAQTRGPAKAQRSPYAQYDRDGNLIDENMPGRW